MVVLVNPYTFRGNDTYLAQWEICEHLGIAHLLASLRAAGFPARVVNAYLRELSLADTVELVAKDNPRLVGVSVLNENYTWARQFVRALKKDSPDTRVVFGGYFATIMGDRILKANDDVDYVVVGDGEGPIVELAEAVEGRRSFEAVAGLVYRKSSNIYSVPVGRFQQNLDELPFPARDDMGFAIDVLRSSGASPAIRLMTSRGCSYRCSFCNIVEYSGRIDGGRRRVRSRSASAVCDEIELLVKEHNVSTFVISDDVFLDRSLRSRARVEEFMDELDERRLSIRFACQFRLDAFDPVIFERMLDHGLVAVAFGIESIEQGTIDFFQKDTTNTKMLEALEQLSAFAGAVNISLYMLLYHPFTTMEEIANNYEFLSELGYLDVDNERSILRKMLTTRLQVFRGGRLEDQLARMGLLVDYDPSALEPTILDFKYVDHRVPEFLSAVDRDRSESSVSIRRIFESRLDEHLRRPGNA